MRGGANYFATSSFAWADRVCDKRMLLEKSK